MHSTAIRIGFWSAALSFFGAITYAIAQIFSPPLIPLLRYPWNDILIIAPSLLLAIAFVVALSCLHIITPEEKRAWSQIALSLATLYAVFVGFVYIIQLATVIPFTLKGEGESVTVVALSKSHWIQAVDGFGYALMSLSALFAAFVFASEGFEGRARKVSLVHGALAPFVVLPLWFPPAIVIGALWLITGPLFTWILADYFRRKMVGE